MERGEETKLVAPVVAATHPSTLYLYGTRRRAPAGRCRACARARVHCHLSAAGWCAEALKHDDRRWLSVLLASLLPAVPAQSTLSTLLQRLELPADYGQRLENCGLSDADLPGASMATLMSCGLKVGHARRLHSKLQA